MSIQLSNSSIRLLISNTFLRGARILVQIFLSIYVWKQTQDLAVIAWFNVILHVFHMVGALIGAYFVKSGYRNQVNAIAFILNIIIYMICIVLWNSIIDYIYILGGCLWLCYWAYYINYNVNQFDMSHFKNRWNLEWVKKSLKIAQKMFFPLLFGFIITLYNMQVAFGLGTLLLVFGMYFWNISFAPSKGVLNIWKCISIISQNKKILFSLAGSFFMTIAFSMTLIDIIISIILFEQVGTEFQLWIALSMISLISIWLVYIFWKFTQYKDYNKWLVIFTVFYFISVFLFLYVESYIVTLIVSSCLTTVILLYQLMASVMNANSLKWWSDVDDYKIEFYLLRDGVNVWGWLIWFTVMWLVWDISPASMTILFSIMSLFAIITTWCLLKVNIHELE